MNRHSTHFPILTTFILLSVGSVAWTACGNTDIRRLGQRVTEVVEPSPRARYLKTLATGEGGGLRRDAWSGAGQRALEAPWPVPLPFREVAGLEADRASAWSFPIQEGERLVITVDLTTGSTPPLLVDLFGPPEWSGGNDLLIEAHIAALPGGGWNLEAHRNHNPQAVTLEEGRMQVILEPGVAGDYLLRLQPEAGRSGRIALEATGGPSLGFPVEGHSHRAIQSVWGDPRDGGARRHEGVDIFAPRGHPVVAASDGYVSWVGESGRGGNVVWVYDSDRGHAQYYAHLDSQAVTTGQPVRKGDLLGTVGNTGNARTTKPHLHFGIYRRGRGAVNPWPFLFEPKAPDLTVAGPTELVGQDARVKRKSVQARALAPTPVTIPGKKVKRKGKWVTLPSEQRLEVAVLATLPKHTAVRVIAAFGRQYRIALPDGRIGVVPASALEPIPAPVAANTPSDT